VRRDDVFDGDVEFRLRRVSARVRAAAFDAQVRDWVAERPDRVGFARLAQAHWSIAAAASRYGRALPPDLLLQFAAPLAGVLATLAVLLVADRPAALPVLIVAIAAGPIVGQSVMSVTAAVRRRSARRAGDRPAAIDDPYFHADVARRLEACAAAARADRSEQHRAAAGDVEVALTWLSAARGDR
jgi:hypothetical protein